MGPQQPTREQLIEQHQGLARSLAQRIGRTLPSHVELDDLMAYGLAGLVEAAQSFDASRGNQFSTYAYYRVRGAIYDGLSKMNWMSRAQYRRVRNQQLAGEVLEVQGEENSDSSTTKVEDDAQWLKRTSGALGVVYLMTQRDDGESEESNLVDPSSPTPAAIVTNRETTARLNEIIDELPVEAAKLIRALYFDGLTLQEAGKRIGVSKAWACRLHARTLERLARSLRQIGVSDCDD